jgi:hypothetical protein
VTPAEEPGSGSRDPAVASLLRWYPKAWRQRYGEEFLAMVEDGLDGQRPTWRLTASVAWAGLRQRGRALFSGRALARGARGIDSVLYRWWPSVVTANILAFLPATIGASSPGGRTWQVMAALDAMVAVTALIGLAVLAGGLVAFSAFRRFLRTGGWATIRWRVAWAAGATVVAGGALTGLFLWSRSQTFAQLNISVAYFGWLSVTTMALISALRLWTSAAKATARQLDLSPRERTAEVVLGVLTRNWAFVMASANGLWIAALQSSVPLLVIPVACLAVAPIQGRMQMRQALGRAGRPRRGRGPGRHVYRGG